MEGAFDPVLLFAHNICIVFPLKRML